MLHINIITVGKIKEDYLTSAIKEYTKRLSAYCNLEIMEVKDEPTPLNPSDREKQIVMTREGNRIEHKIPNGSIVVAMCIEGKEVTSEELADFIETSSRISSKITIIIGGSFGLSDEIKKRANYRISFSRLTFPHQLMRVILTEQLYRAFTIINGKTYHK